MVLQRNSYLTMAASSRKMFFKTYVESWTSRTTSQPPITPKQMGGRKKQPKHLGRNTYVGSRPPSWLGLAYWPAHVGEQLPTTNIDISSNIRTIPFEVIQSAHNQTQADVGRTTRWLQMQVEALDSWNQVEKQKTWIRLKTVTKRTSKNAYVIKTKLYRKTTKSSSVPNGRKEMIFDTK